jgi:hypothetical protein
MQLSGQSQYKASHASASCHYTIGKPGVKQVMLCCPMYYPYTAATYLLLHVHRRNYVAGCRPGALQMMIYKLCGLQAIEDCRHEPATLASPSHPSDSDADTSLEEVESLHISC